MIRKVAVIMGSDSDWPVVKGACAQLKALDIPFEAHILSAHRTPAEAAEFAKNARANGFGVILCAAGMAAHLAGAFAANTTLPVIGIPMKGGAMDGLDALLATVQMPTSRTVPRMKTTLCPVRLVLFCCLGSRRGIISWDPSRLLRSNAEHLLLLNLNFLQKQSAAPPVCGRRGSESSIICSIVPSHVNIENVVFYRKKVSYPHGFSAFGQDKSIPSAPVSHISKSSPPCNLLESQLQYP